MRTLLALLLTAGVATADTIHGYDTLGVAMYCNRFLGAPKLPAMSVLMNTFGDPLPCVEKRILMGGLDVVQVDLIDATCWRNHNCAPGVPRPDDLGVIRKRAREVEKLASKYPGTQFWVSPALEHDVKDSARVVAMLQAASVGCPSCQVINSPFTGATPSGWKVERHGTKVRAFSVSGDGQSSFDADNIRTDNNDFQHRLAGEHTTFMWWPELNLRCTGEEKPPPPKLRTEKPTLDQFRQAAQIVQPEPPIPAHVPPSCELIRKVSSNEIYKPNAESYCNGQTTDPRGNKPLLIIKKRGKVGQRLKVMNPLGGQVGCFRYYGTYPEMPGTHRWYMGDCSGETPARLMEEFGGEWGYVQLGPRECLLLNAVRRMGRYR